MDPLVLYTAIPSRGLVVHWMLEELGVSYECRVLDLSKNEHQTPAYRAINPMARVPALVQGDTVVTETPAICLYLADAFPEAGLGVSVSSAARGAFLRWIFFGPMSVEPSLFWTALGLFESDRGYHPYAPLETVVETLEGAVTQTHFVVDDRFTAADVVLGSTIFWGTELLGALPKRPALVDYWARLEQRPAWQVVRKTLHPTP